MLHQDLASSFNSNNAPEIPLPISDPVLDFFCLVSLLGGLVDKIMKETTYPLESCPSWLVKSSHDVVGGPSDNFLSPSG